MEILERLIEVLGPIVWMVVIGGLAVTVLCVVLVAKVFAATSKRQDDFRKRHGDLMNRRRK